MIIRLTACPKKNHARCPAVDRAYYFPDVFRYLNFFMKSTKSLKKILVNLGEKLAELRVKKGYETLKEFTLRYDLPQIQYWRIEKGRANITIKTLVKILTIHNLTIHEFFSMVTQDDEHLV